MTTAALGLEPGVHIDPGSPAAKEYALPLNQARQTGANPSGPNGSESSFGAGIKPPTSGGSGGSGAAGAGSVGGSHARGRAGGSQPGGSQPGGSRATGDKNAASQPKLPAAVQRAVASASSGGGNGSLPALIGGGVAIIVLGAFGGTVLRHSRRPTASQ